MDIRRIMTPVVSTIGEDATVVEAARAMRELRVGDLIVVEEEGGKKRPKGILTDRDIVTHVVAQAADELRRLKVGDVVLTSELVTALPREPIEDVLRRMRGRSIRRVPVVDEVGALIGIVTLDDIIGHLASMLDDAAGTIRSQKARVGA